MRRSLAFSLLTAALVGSAGCQLIGATAYYLSPERKQPAHFTPTTNRLAIIIEPRSGIDVHPLFAQGLHEKIIELLAEQDVNERVAPYAEQLELRQTARGYASWSIQRIGRELGAEQVIYIEVTSFVMRRAPNYPTLEPRVAVQVKVIDANTVPGTSPRLWPTDGDGYELTMMRLQREVADRDEIDAEAVKLGRDLAQHVARIFYEHSLEETIPKEP